MNWWLDTRYIDGTQGDGHRCLGGELRAKKYGGGVIPSIPFLQSYSKGEMV